MPEPRLTVRVLAGLAGALLAAVGLAPGALAQSDEVAPPDTGDPQADPDGRWAGSEFASPFDESARTLRQETFTVAGTFRYEKAGPTDHIVGAVISIVDDPTDDFEPREECLFPEPAVVPGQEPEPDFTSELPFAVEMTVPCNGRYLVEAEATVNNADATYTMRRSFLLAVLPAAVTELSVDLDAEARRATVEFTPLAVDELAPDAIGYAVERGGPADEGSFGMYEDVAILDLDDEPRVVDDLAGADGGEYSYRVRSLRDGADGPVRSSIIDTESAGITLEGPPATSTPTSEAAPRQSSRGGRVISRRPSTTLRPAPRQTTPTTLDTGFEETIDYGDRPPGGSDLPGDEPLAGQSIVRDEGEPMDLAAPAAGALVLLGWAGHIVYLNRLARQL